MPPPAASVFRGVGLAKKSPADFIGFNHYNVLAPKFTRQLRKRITAENVSATTLIEYYRVT